MNLDYDIRKLNNEHRIEQRKIDEKHIEFFQEGLHILTELGETENAETYDWVLELVDRLQEAGYEYERLEEELKEAKQYIEDWQVHPKLGKHFDERF